MTSSVLLLLAGALATLVRPTPECFTYPTVANETTDTVTVIYTLYDRQPRPTFSSIDSLRFGHWQWIRMPGDSVAVPARQQVIRRLPPRLAMMVALLPGCRGGLDRHGTEHGIQHLVLRGPHRSVAYVAPDLYRAFAHLRAGFYVLEFR